ncbi:MAG TPA: hypothetical protein VGO79_04600 [Thermoanaerobaculia bacterium]
MNRKIVVSSLLVLLAFVTGPLKAEDKTIARFRAFAINMNGGPRTNAGTVDIGISRWSTEAERDALIATLKEKGSTALLDALTKQPEAGFIKMPNTLGWTLYYARKTDLPDGGQRIVIATNRRLGFGEVSQQKRSVNYDFTLIEMHIPKGGGKGEGKMVPAAKVTWDKETNQIDIENYQAMPVQLKNIEEVKP